MYPGLAHVSFTVGLTPLIQSEVFNIKPDIGDKPHPVIFTWTHQGRDHSS